MEVFRFSPRPNRAHEIRWREWGPEAFQEAQRLDRPVLLAISAIWCHWCHVMDETTYSAPRVMELLNREFIPIRVDNDRQPEVNQRYNMGGWPTTAFLTPQGDILTGATYLPAEGLHSVASQVLQYYRSRKAELYSRILEPRARGTPPAVTAAVSGEIPSRVLAHLAQTYDSQYGGFGTAPKFPQAEALELLLEEYYRTREERWAQMAAKALKAMATGGIFDQEAGGFFRYSTNQDWSIPHYEKMSQDNAALLRVFLHGAQVLEDPELGRVAGRTVDYVLSSLYQAETGAFYGSQDADEEYYQLPPEERARRDPPLVDRTVYTDWAAAMAASFLQASRILRRPELGQAALRALDFLWASLHREGQGMYHCYHGQASGPGLLVDQVWSLAAFLDAHEATARPLYLERARALADLVCGRFRDPEGGFFDIWEGYQALGRLRERDKSIAENALAAEGLMRLFYLAGGEEYREAAQGALGAFASDYLRFGPNSASYARAVGWFLEEPLRIVIVGQEEAIRPLREAALAFYHPRRLVQTVDPAREAGRLEELGIPPSRGPNAYLCYQGACSAPVQDVAGLPLALKALAVPSAE